MSKNYVRDNLTAERYRHMQPFRKLKVWSFGEQLGSMYQIPALGGWYSDCILTKHLGHLYFPGTMTSKDVVDRIDGMIREKRRADREAAEAEPKEEPKPVPVPADPEADLAREVIEEMASGTGAFPSVEWGLNAFLNVAFSHWMGEPINMMSYVIRFRGLDRERTGDWLPSFDRLYVAKAFNAYNRAVYREMKYSGHSLGDFFPDFGSTDVDVTFLGTYMVVEARERVPLTGGA